MDTRYEFTDKAMGEINELLDKIGSICYEAMTGGGERHAVGEIQTVHYEIRKKIKEQGIIVHNSNRRQ